MKFQFHKGTIKTDIKDNTMIGAACFNSIKVRLRLKKVSIHQVKVDSFNSIKVRLRQPLLST